MVGAGVCSTLAGSEGVRTGLQHGRLLQVRNLFQAQLHPFRRSDKFRQAYFEAVVTNADLCGGGVIVEAKVRHVDREGIVASAAVSRWCLEGQGDELLYVEQRTPRRVASVVQRT